MHRRKRKGESRAALFHTSEHFECFLCASLEEYAALHVPVNVLNNVGILWGDSIVCHEFPKHFTVYTVKCLFKVYEIDMDRCSPFYRLLNNDPEASNLVAA